MLAHVLALELIKASENNSLSLCLKLWVQQCLIVTIWLAVSMLNDPNKKTLQWSCSYRCQIHKQYRDGCSSDWSCYAMNLLGNIKYDRFQGIHVPNGPFSRDASKAVHLGSMATYLPHYSCAVKVNCALLNSRKTGQYSQIDSMLWLSRWRVWRGTGFGRLVDTLSEIYGLLNRGLNCSNSVWEQSLGCASSVALPEAIINPKGWFKVAGCISL